MWLNEARNTLYSKCNAGFEEVKLEFVTKSKIPSFEIKRLEEKNGVISEEQQLYSVEISYKKKYNNITKTYFLDFSIAREYYSKVSTDMSYEVLGRAYVSEKASELKKIAKVRHFHTQVAVASNPSTSAETLQFLCKKEFQVKNFVLNNLSADIELLKSVIEENENIASVMIAKENLRRRNLLCQK